MSIRAIVLLACMTLVASVAAFWSWSSGQRVSDGFEERGRPVFTSLSGEAAGLDRIEITRPGYELTLQRKGGRWIASEHGDYPVADELANRLISEVASLRRWEAKTERPAFFPLLGVEDSTAADAASSHVSLRDDAGAVLADLIVGRQSASIGARAGGGSFIRVADEPRAWLVEGVVTLPDDLGGWIGTVMRIPATQVRRVSLYDGDKLLVDASKPADGGIAYALDFVAADLAAPGSVVANDEAIKSMARGVVSVAALDVRAATKERTAGRRVVFETVDGLQVTAWPEQQGDETWVTFDVQAMPGSAGAEMAEAIASRTNEWAFLLDSSRSAPFLVPAAELFQPAGTASSPPSAVPSLPPGLMGPGVMPVIPALP